MVEISVRQTVSRFPMLSACALAMRIVPAAGARQLILYPEECVAAECEAASKRDRVVHEVADHTAMDVPVLLLDLVG